MALERPVWHVRSRFGRWVGVLARRGHEHAGASRRDLRSAGITAGEGLRALGRCEQVCTGKAVGSGQFLGRRWIVYADGEEAGDCRD